MYRERESERETYMFNSCMYTCIMYDIKRYKSGRGPRGPWAPSLGSQGRPARDPREPPQGRGTPVYINLMYISWICYI